MINPKSAKDRALKAIEEGKEREDEYFKRHGIDNSHGPNGEANPAHKAWVKAVEHEYGLMGKESRVHLDMPISRKAFITGYRAAEAPLLACIKELEKFNLKEQNRHEELHDKLHATMDKQDARIAELEEMLRVATNALEYYAAMKYDAGKREWMSSAPGKAVSVLARLSGKEPK